MAFEEFAKLGCKMKKILLVIFVVLLGLKNLAFANEISVVNGGSHLNKGKYNSLEVNGNLEFKDLVIKNLLIVNGSIQGKNLKCKTMKSNGSVDVNGLQAQTIESNGLFLGKNTDIAGRSEFNGSLEITKGKLHDMQIASTRSTIIDTKVSGNIYIKKVNKGWSFGLIGKPSIQILELKGNSLVKGDIIFEEGGAVHLFDKATVKGKIVNAKMVK